MHSFTILIFILVLVVVYGSATSEIGIADNISNYTLMHESHVMIGLKDPRLVREVIEERAILPTSANVWNTSIEVRDQGPWGSCTAFATRYAYLINLAKTEAIVEPSTAFWYAKARLLNPGKVPLTDSGTRLSSVMSVLSACGTLPESAWLYTAQNIFALPNSAPSATTKLTQMRALPISISLAANLAALKTGLSSGHPVLISIYVYASFMTRAVFTTGVVPVPKRGDTLLGGHAICLTGYSDSSQTFSFYNSWGTYTGIGGLFTIPYAYASSPNYAGEYFSF